MKKTILALILVFGVTALHAEIYFTQGNAGNIGSGPSVNLQSVPEPSQVAASLLLAAGIAGFVIVRRRKALVA
jgi:hypothetical protein